MKQQDHNNHSGISLHKRNTEIKKNLRKKKKEEQEAQQIPWWTTRVGGYRRLFWKEGRSSPQERD